MHRVETVEELPDECLFFGYGSLMYHHGINGRGLDHKYKSNKELTPVTIKGLKRSMSAEVWLENGYKVRFYSVIDDNVGKTFGMLFKVHSHHDIVALLYNEGSKPIHTYGHYLLHDITDMLDKDYGLSVYTLFCPEKEDRPELYYPGYVKRVYKSIPDKHKKAFTNTNGLKPEKVDHKCGYVL